MVRSITGSICALALVTVTAAHAQDVVTGTLERVDARAGVVVLEDGRVIPTTGDNVFLVETPAPRLAAVRPGTRVVVIETSPLTDSPSPSPFLTPPATTPDAAASRELQAP
jgi:hypothetical protein